MSQKKIRHQQVDAGQGPNQLVKLDETGKLPPLDGSNLINVPGTGELINDTSPQLGGNLDLNAFNIFTTNVGSPVLSHTNDFTFNGGHNYSAGGSYTAGGFIINAGVGYAGNEGGQVDINAGNSVGGIGGYVSIIAGTGAGGGDVTITSGSASSASGAGDVTITSGDRTDAAAGAAAGNIVIQGGVSTTSTSGNGGEVTIQGGQGTGNGGDVQIFGGASTTGTSSGSVTIRPGNANDASAPGSLNLEGSLGGNTGDGGDINITPGSVFRLGSASAGNIVLTPGGTTTSGTSGVTLGNIDIHSPNNRDGEGSIRFWNDTNTGHTTGNYIELQAPQTTANRTWLLPDEDPSTVTGRFLTTTATGELYFGSPAIPEAGAQSLNDLTDVTVGGSPLEGHVLTYQSGQWVNSDNITGNLSVSGQVLLANGSNTAPGLAFSNTTNMGLYRQSSTIMSFVTSGLLRFDIGSTIHSRVQHNFNSGSAATPTIGHLNDNGTGIYFVNPDEVHIATGGIDRFGVLSDGTLSVAGTTNYETLVSDDDDIPNKKYVDDAVVVSGAVSLNDLTDVIVAGSPVVEGQVLTYVISGSPATAHWSNEVPAGAFSYDGDGARNLYGGTGAGNSITTGDDNFLAGSQAGTSINSGSNNIAIGSNAMLSGTNVSNSVAIGFDALRTTILGTNLVAVGFEAGEDAGVTANNSVFVGYRAGANNDAVTSNTFVGALAGEGIDATSDGDQNCGFGREALENFTTGAANIAIGYLAGMNISTGSNNTIIGTNSGQSIITGDDNLIIGVNAGPTSDVSSQLFIDIAETDTPLIHGNFGTNEVTINGDLNVTGSVTGGASKPHFEAVTPAGSPPSEIINTSVTTVAIGGSPQTAGVQVFRNGMLQDESVDLGSPATITEDFAVTGPNQITFAPGILKEGDKIRIFAFV